MLSRAAVLLTLTLAVACGSSPPPASPPPAPATPAPPASSADTSATTASADSAAAPASPELVVLAHGLGAVDDMAASSGFVYVARRTSLVTRIAINGGAMADVATFENQATINAIAACDDGVYVLVTAIGAEATKGGYAGQGSLFLVPAKGGDAQSLAQGFRRPTSIVIDDTMVRWAAVKDTGKKSSWALFSAPRKTGTPVTSTALGESAADAKVASDNKTARLLGEANGSAVVSWDSGVLVLHPFDRTPKNPPPLGLGGYAFTDPRMALHGDHAVIGGVALHDGKTATVVGTIALAAPAKGETQALAALATLDAASSIGGVAFAGDDVVYSVDPTKDIHDKHGSIVRVSASDKTSTVLATDQFQPAKIVTTTRGLVWMDKGANEAGDPDGTLVLLPR